MNKDVATDDQIMKIIYNFKAMSVQSWVTADKDRLLALTFKEFMGEFKSKFLACLWKDARPDCDAGRQCHPHMGEQGPECS